MLPTLARVGIALVLVSAILYQVALKDILFVSIGLGRIVGPLSDFPYNCRRLGDPKLQACEDIWLSEKHSILFLACSGSLARKQWVPNIAKLNVSGRSRTDAIVALYIDKPRGESYEYQVMLTPGFSYIDRGDPELHVLGLANRDRGDGAVQLLLVNNKPQVDVATGEHVRSYAHAKIATPKSIALDGETSFWITNDHGVHKTGWRNQLSSILDTADIAYCAFSHTTQTTNYKPVISGLRFPNGLIKGDDDLIYVPHSFPSGINVYRSDTNGSLTKVDNIPIDYALDNLSQDGDGTIFAAGFPKMIPTLAAFEDPMNVFPPSTILKVHKDGNGYIWEKVIEDADGEALGMSTVAVSNAKTGRLFIGSALSPFVTVCEKR